MSGKRTGCATALLALLLILPFVDAALISMLVRSIQENKPETGLFLIAYLQLVPQEIAVRALLQKKKNRGWRYWTAWICRWSGILLAIPYAYGIAGALVDVLYKETLLLLEEKEKEKEKEKQRQAVQPVLSVHGAPAAAPASPAATRGPAPVGRSPLPPQPKAAPASPAARPLPYPPHKSNDSGQDSPADLSPEEKLAAQKAAYEKRVGGQAAQKPTADMTPQEMLRKVTERVFSEGKAAAELGGQRQLVYWMARAVPPLNGLMQLESGKDFFAPALENNPAVFLPLLDKLLAEAARLLANSNKRTEKDAWSRMEPEEICAGWYALAKYTAAGGREQSFADAAARMERFIMKDKRCVAWLKENCAAEEEGILL